MSAEDTLFLSIDGVTVDAARPAVRAGDRGLAYGDGVFRTVRVASGRVAAWSRHARKLDTDCRRLGLHAPDLPLIERELSRLAIEHPHCVARISVTAGVGARGYRRSGSASTLLVQATPVPAWPADWLQHGVAVHLCALRLAHQPALAGVKHLNRLEQVLARAEWTDPGVAEGLTLDSGDHAICGTMSNLFIVEAGRLVTPELSRCGVAGVQRERILAWAAAQSIDARVEPVPLARVLAADALLLSNSVIGAWWVRQLGGRSFAAPAWLAALQAALGQDDPQ